MCCVVLIDEELTMNKPRKDRLDITMEISDRICNFLQENHVNKLEFKCIIFEIIRRVDEDSVSFVESIKQVLIAERKRNPKPEPKGFLSSEDFK